MHLGNIDVYRDRDAMLGLPSRSKRWGSAFAQDGLRRDSLRRAALAKAGAAEGIRTPDPRITNAVLYQLSYRGLSGFSHTGVEIATQMPPGPTPSVVLIPCARGRTPLP